MRRYMLAAAVLLLLGAASLLLPPVRRQVRALIRNDPPPQITALPLAVPASSGRADRQVSASPRPSATPLPTETVAPGFTGTPSAKPATATPTPSATPAPPATSTPIVINGKAYAAYIPAAVKDSQAYKYSCEFDAAWVILETYGIDVSVDQLIGIVGVDRSIEPYIEETAEGFIIHGGDITSAFSGDYTSNFLARSSGAAMAKAFAHFGLEASPVHDRAGVEQALSHGHLVWMKTTVDFNVWRPATWRMPDGRTLKTVLGNDHAVVVMGYNDEVVIIRDVLGPTSSNWQRPYEYAVDWKTFLAAWQAQSFDGLAVAPPDNR